MKFSIKNLTTHLIHINLKRDKSNKLTKNHDRITLLPGVFNDVEVSKGELKQIKRWLDKFEASDRIVVKEVKESKPAKVKPAKAKTENPAPVEEPEVPESEEVEEFDEIRGLNEEEKVAKPKPAKVDADAPQRKRR